MKKRGPKAKEFTAEFRLLALKAIRDGYSLGRINRATGVSVERLVIWRDEEGIEPILHTSGARRELPELVFDL